MSALLSSKECIYIMALFRDFFAIPKPLGIMGQHSSKGEHNREPFVRYSLF